MPNTPALVGEAVTAICPNANITDGEKQEIVELIASFGLAQIVSEKIMDAVIAVVHRHMYLCLSKQWQMRR